MEICQDIGNLEEETERELDEALSLATEEELKAVEDELEALVCNVMIYIIITRTLYDM